MTDATWGMASMFWIGEAFFHPNVLMSMSYHLVYCITIHNNHFKSPQTVMLTFHFYSSSRSIQECIWQIAVRHWYCCWWYYFQAFGWFRSRFWSCFRRKTTGKSINIHIYFECSSTQLMKMDLTSLLLIQLMEAPSLTATFR